jgi:hypothetical protein
MDMGYRTVATLMDLPRTSAMFSVSTSTISLVEGTVGRLLISAFQRNAFECNPFLDGSDRWPLVPVLKRGIRRTATADRTLDTEVHELPVIVGLDSHDKGGIGQGDGFNGYTLGKGVAGNGVGVCEVLLGEPDHSLQPLGDQGVGLILNRSVRKADPEIGQGLLLQVGQLLA